MFSVCSRQLIVNCSLFAACLIVQSSVLAAEYYGDSGSGSTSTMDGDYSSPQQELFAPESYNPYLPQQRYPRQQQYYVPAPVVSPQPVYPQSSQSLYPQSPLAAPVAPAQSPVVTVPPAANYYMPPLSPGLNIYSPSLYSPGLYNPGSTVFPGYFYPFNNSQGVFPAF